MKARSFSISILAAVAVMTMGLLVAPLNASQYLGEVVWNGQGGDGAFTMKAGISRAGDSYYQIQGQLVGTCIFSGGGVLAGNSLIFVVTQGPTMDGQQQSGVMQIIIDKTTCNGTYSKVKPMFFIPRTQLQSVALLPPHLQLGSGPEESPPYTYPCYINSHITGPNWPYPEDLGNPATTGTLTATKTISLAPRTTSSLPLLLE